MYMLNVVPIQFLAMFAYLFLRITVGITLLLFGAQLAQLALSMSTLTSRRAYLLILIAILSLVSSGLLILGLFTQIGALFVIGLAFTQLVAPNHTIKGLIPSSLVWFLLLGAGVSLFITGAGVFAFDLPI